MKQSGLWVMAIVACLGTAGVAQTAPEAQARCLEWITPDRCTCAAERLSPKHLDVYTLWESAFVADKNDAALKSVLAVSGWGDEENFVLETGLEKVRKECPGGLNYAKVVTATSEAIELNPQNANAFNRRGFAYAEQGNYALAIADYDAAIRLQPASHGLLASRCRARARSGRDLDLALADCNQSLAVDSFDTGTLDSRGLVHLRRGEFEDAFADYDRAVQISRDARSSSLYGRGLARLRMGKTAEGQADINAAVARDPKVTAGFYRYGLAP